MPQEQPKLDRLQAVLLTSGIQTKQPALYQVITQLIQAVKQLQNATKSDIDISVGAITEEFEHHADRHENNGADEIDVTGLDGLLADPQTPLAHNTTHQNGGTDEINVVGLSGLLADPQNSIAHTHPESDIINLVPDLAARVVGPAASVDNRLVTFNGVTGKLVKDNGLWIFTASSGLLETGNTAADVGIKVDTAALAVTALSARLGDNSDFSRMLALAYIGIRAVNTASGPAFQWRKARGTPGAEANTQNVDQLGIAQFFGWNNGAYRPSADMDVRAAAAASGLSTNPVPTHIVFQVTNLAYVLGEGMRLTSERNLVVIGGITHGSPILLTTTIALTNGAAAQLGTLNNAPIAGNPTKWIPINDNGTTRYIPAW